jgi:hypothetical protein
MKITNKILSLLVLLSLLVSALPVYAVESASAKSEIPYTDFSGKFATSYNSTITEYDAESAAVAGIPNGFSGYVLKAAPSADGGYAAIELDFSSWNISVADIFIAALAHDFCKTNFYEVEYRNTKDISGNWIKQPFYKTKSDNRNLGHGNESVLILLKILPSYINNRPVIEAISRHMGFSDLSESEGYNYSLFLQNPLVILLQLADQTAAQWFNA